MSKKNYHFIVMAFMMLLFTHQSFAQGYCGDTTHFNVAGTNDFNRFVEKFKAFGGDRNTDLKVIPVVIHVIYRNTADSLSMSRKRIEEQIEITNKSLRRLNANARETRRMFRPVAADCNIQVALAGRKPDGRRFNGIIYHHYPNVDTAGSVPQFNEDVEQIRNETAIDPDRYLNVWVFPVVHLASAIFPWDKEGAKDGFWIGAPILGVRGPDLSHLQNGGATFTHELGHYLGLWHTFDLGQVYPGECERAHDPTISDFCGDTPLDWRFHSGIPEERDFGVQQCNDGSILISQTENYMFYNADRWLNMFSKDQRARMRACLFAYRFILTNPINLFLTGVRPRDIRDSYWDHLAQDYMMQDMQEQEGDKSVGAISISPNPASGMVHLDYNRKDVKDVSIQVYSPLGQVVKEVRSGSAINELNLESLADGVYYMVITTDSGRETKRIIKAAAGVPVLQ